MANPKSILTIAIGKMGPKEESKEDESKELPIKELVEKVFTTRNLIHFAHWNSKLFGEHVALGELYDDIVEDVDELVECYQGKFGLLTELETECACLPKDITKWIEDEMQWVEDNRFGITKGNAALASIIDVMITHYQRTLYKLKNLK